MNFLSASPRRNIALILLLSLVALAPHGAYARDDKALFDKLTELANGGNLEAQYHLGMLYSNGTGTTRDLKKAFELLQQAADAGEPLAAYQVHTFYTGQFKDVVEADPVKSLKYHVLASKAGYALAQVELGDLYAVQKQVSKAEKWWELAGEQGDTRALTHLASMYRDGKGVKKDPVLAYTYLKKAASLSQKDVDPEAKASLNAMASKLTPAQRAKIEHVITKWKPLPTPLTIRAGKGLKAAEELVADEQPEGEGNLPIAINHIVSIDIISLIPRISAGASLGQTWHKYPVLQRRTVSETKQIREIAQALRLELAPPQSSKCVFEPEHGLRVQSKESQVDYLICYKCGDVQRFIDERMDTLSVQPTDSKTYPSKAVLDRLLFQ